MVRVKEGRTITRAFIAERVMAHGQARGEPYVIRWEATDGATAAEQLERGLPFALPGLDGTTVDFGAILGQQPAVLVFWASWCGPCLLEAPHLQQLHADLGDRVAIVSVAIDEPETQRKLAATVSRLGLTYPVALDPEGTVLKQYAPGGTIPLTLVLDVEGAVQYRRGNFEAGDEAALIAAVRQIATP